jgi:hypothetical protein
MTTTWALVEYQGFKTSSPAPHQSHLTLSGRSEHRDPGTMTFDVLKED